MKVLLVDDEEQVVKGVSRSLSIERDDWEIATALSGEQALEMLNNERFDAVVSDMRMPEMDGPELLAEIEKLYPGVLRVVLSGQADRESVLRAIKPMHQYLAKPCEPSKLVEIIDRAEIMQKTIVRTDVLEAIGRADCLPAFPDIVAKIDNEVASDTGTSKSIANIIAQDTALTARVLQLANSSLFGQRAAMADIERAVSLVGVDMVRSLALSQVVYDMDSNSDVLSARELMDHGMEVAIAAGKLAEKEGYPHNESVVAFTASLLHDVGKLIMLNTFPEQYHTVASLSDTSEFHVHQLEIEMFSATHQGIGAYLFALWGLPAEVVASVAYHHNVSDCARAPGMPRQLVFAANWICRNDTEDDLRNQVSGTEDVEDVQQFIAQVGQWREYLEIANET